MGALEPVISAEIMQLHHSKHHQTYVNNLNAAEEKLAEASAKNDVSAIIGLQGALKFNGGGHSNHSIFWQNSLRETLEEHLKQAVELLKDISATNPVVQVP